MITSVVNIRNAIAKTLEELGPDSKIRLLLEEMRNACHEFQQYLEGLHYLQSHILFFS